MSEIYEQGMTDQEIRELEAAREAAHQALIAPFEAIKKRVDMSLRANIKAGNILPEEIIEQKDAFPALIKGLDLKPGDIVRAGDDLLKVVDSLKVESDWGLGQKIAAQFEKVENKEVKQA